MSVKEIEKAIQDLPRTEVAEIASWVANYHARLWDEQIAEDLAANRLDHMIREVDAGYDAGLAKPL